jgi:hypothetical protein
MVNKYIILEVIVFLQAIAACAQTSRPIQMEFLVENDQLIKIDNKKMAVTIKTWDRNSIKLESTIKGQGIQDISAENLFHLVGVGIRSNAKEFRVESKSTLVESVNASGSKRIYRSNAALKAYLDSVDKVDNRFKLVSSLANDTYKIGKTSLTLYVPAKRFLKIDSKYGDIHFDGRFTHIQIDVKNGNLKLQDVDSLKMDAEFGNISFNSIKWGKIDLDNATLIGNRLMDVNLDSESSTINYKYGERIKLDSKMDDISLGSIAIIEGDKDFKQITVDTLRVSMNLDGDNADIKISYLRPSVKFIDIKNKYGTIQVPLAQLQHFTLQVEGAASVFPPFENGEKKEETVIASEKDSIYSLRRGRLDKESTQIRFRCQSCIVNMR